MSPGSENKTFVSFKLRNKNVKGRRRRNITTRNESLWCGNRNHLVCRRWKCEVDHPSRSTVEKIGKKPKWCFFESWWNGSGTIKLSTGETVIYSGHDDDIHQQGVAKSIGTSLSNWLCTSQWEDNRCKVLLTAHQTDGYSCILIRLGGRRTFLWRIKDVAEKLHRHDIPIITCDMNAKVWGEDIAIDHLLVSTNVKFKLKKITTPELDRRRMKFDTDKMK